jgi:SOS-response transcriptional repressor LexA
MRAAAMPLPLTERQQQAFNWIVAYIVANHGWPTVREIGRALGSTSSPATIGSEALLALVAKGWIERRDGRTGKRNGYRLTTHRLMAVPHTSAATIAPQVTTPNDTPDSGEIHKGEDAVEEPGLATG